MIKFLNGTVDKRVVLRSYLDGLATYVDVLNEDGTYDRVCVDDSNSSGYLEPIHGGKLADFVLDSSVEQFKKYIRDRKKYFAAPYLDTYEKHQTFNYQPAILAEKGYVIEVVKGRKIPVGTRGYYISKTYVYKDFGRIIYLNIQTKDKIISVDEKNCIIANIDGNDLNCERLTLEDRKMFNY